MRVVWVPQLAVLPVIVEDRAMLDEQGRREYAPTVGQSPENAAQLRPGESDGRTAPGNLRAEERQYDFNQNAPSFHQPFSGGHSFHLPGPHSIPQAGRRQSPGSFNMVNIAAALPEHQSPAGAQTPGYDQQRGYASPPPHLQGYSGQTLPNHLNPGGYPVHPQAYGAPFTDAVSSSTGYGPLPNMHHHQHAGAPGSIHSGFPNPYYPAQQQRQQSYLPIPSQYGHSNQLSFASQYPPGSAFGPHAGDLTVAGRLPPGNYAATATYPSPGPSQYIRSSNVQAVPRTSANSGGGGGGGNIPSTPRGPPRKPKQSGNALWVGNLPSGTIVSDLKDHFSRDATKDIESVFLISKSNCAFVNYRTEAACAAAMTRFHDSRFHGVRLVCRLRRTTTTSPAPGTPTGPAALVQSQAQSQNATEPVPQSPESSAKGLGAPTDDSSQAGESVARAPDKYFVMKSLTIEDMELSVRNKIWATQAHNEEALNRAYETAENVFLIFSANKSGEYFGLARMSSPINDEAAADLDWAPRGQTVTDDPDLPRSIPTPATEFAPKGRIIDDSARGTIFWEADQDEDDLALGTDADAKEAEAKEAIPDTTEELDDPTSSGDVQTFGKPFKIEWITTNRLPFYRTRGLRNPWNANREVKIARDGTELETGVGRKLVQMFQRSAMELIPPVYGPSRIY